MSKLSKFMVRAGMGAVLVTRLAGGVAVAAEGPSTTAAVEASYGRTDVAAGEVVLGELRPVTRPQSGGGRRATDALVARVPASGGGFGAVDDLEGGPGCSIQCIVSGVAYAVDGGAELVVETDTPAKIWIMVLHPDGHSDVRFSGDSSSLTSFSAVFDDLEPDTLYYGTAVAEDGEGYTSHAYGSFVTP